MINPKSIKLKKAVLPAVSLDKYRTYKRDTTSKLKTEGSEVVFPNLVKILESDVSSKLLEVIHFISNPGKLKLSTKDGYYIVTNTTIYFISNDNTETAVTPTYLFGLFLIACDKGIDCFFEEIK